MTHPIGTKSIQLFRPELGAVSIRPDNSLWLDKDGTSVELFPQPGDRGECPYRGRCECAGACKYGFAGSGAATNEQEKQNDLDA